MGSSCGALLETPRQWIVVMTEPWHYMPALGYHQDYSETTATPVVGGLFLYAVATLTLEWV